MGRHNLSRLLGSDAEPPDDGDGFKHGPHAHATGYGPPPPSYRRRKRRKMRTPLAVISALAVIGAGTVILRSVAADADGCSSSGIRLTVAADPAIAPAIADIGARWSSTHPSVNGACVRVEVVAKPSHEIAEGIATFAGGWVDVAAQPAPTPSEADLPVIWIPDSSYWIGRVLGVNRDAFEGTIGSVASSPVVLAVPENVMRGLNGQLDRGLDTTLIKRLALDPSGKAPLKLGMVEPRRDTAGMVGAMMLSDAVVASEKDLPNLVFAYRSIGAQVNDPEALWQAFANGITGAPVSEQALLTYNAGATGASVPMAAVRLADVASLDFPYAVRSRHSADVRDAAAAFRSAITSPESRTVLAQHRLRSADGAAASGFPTGHGVTNTGVHVQPLSDMAKVQSALRVWIAARTPSRVLGMIDATSSMGLPMGGGKTRMEVMKEAAISGLRLFTNESEVGLWGFAGPGQTPMVPLAPLSKPGQRDLLTNRMLTAGPQPTDVTPLYQSILAGYQLLLENYQPELSNTLVVFTDGQENTGKPLRDVQRELEVLADVTRPIRVVLLGIGPDIKLPDLEAVAHTTGGVAFQVSTPDEMQTIFLKALLA